MPTCDELPQPGRSMHGESTANTLKAGQSLNRSAFIVRSSEEEFQPLTAPAITPLTMYFWQIR
ncbi:hypothetical protein DSM100238_1121 [Bifidobacterium apri]|uniref:Uncharacterized protein n=1 Tax=Bifidobacterium apri TaxID=1769423 RepID=A0A6A2V921_9BIFI|nr:hypothetical protein DSM100238_1121 [Bifidobacterium apri]